MVQEIVQQRRPRRKDQVIKRRLQEHRYWEQLLGEVKLSLRSEKTRAYFCRQVEANLVSTK